MGITNIEMPPEQEFIITIAGIRNPRYVIEDAAAEVKHLF